MRHEFNSASLQVQECNRLFMKGIQAEIQLIIVKMLFDWLMNRCRVIIYSWRSWTEQLHCALLQDQTRPYCYNKKDITSTQEPLTIFSSSSISKRRIYDNIVKCVLAVILTLSQSFDLAPPSLFTGSDERANIQLATSLAYVSLSGFGSACTK